MNALKFIFDEESMVAYNAILSFLTPIFSISKDWVSPQFRQLARMQLSFIILQRQKHVLNLIQTKFISLILEPRSVLSLATCGTDIYREISCFHVLQTWSLPLYIDNWWFLWSI